MSVDQTELENVAALARIRVSADDAAELTRRIGNILELVDQMQAVDTTGVEPLANPLNASQRLRADEVTEVDRRDAFQAIAPATEDGLYLVPRVID
ncbi:MAG: Asp-tRNA(Asn)/Glu-tRNA(Gln) amidotransferase subunit GatC [Halieaceae bacterium]|jgi:aspartyl-tRNA(Asn)/glutamyl-tRNA(Gln) amidotransferase subunit C|nr:Asp-tRNA(Asn)/Glu-tRNA(Gln) amidotransferase subunit GatC [Halieaceae bacterium]